MKRDAAGELTGLLQHRLNALNDLALTLKQAGQLEQFHWFVRAPLESADGTPVTAGARTEKTAAKRARR